MEICIVGTDGDLTVVLEPNGQSDRRRTKIVVGMTLALFLLAMAFFAKVPHVASTCGKVGASCLVMLGRCHPISHVISAAKSGTVA
jgi:hypothetical protein